MDDLTAYFASNGTIRGQKCSDLRILVPVNLLPRAGACVKGHLHAGTATTV
jgi:hypothetical protein